MIRVILSGAMREAAGEESIDIDAGDVKTLFTTLQRDYPGLKPQFQRGVAISIDGTIWRDALLRKLEPGTEVFLLPRLPGG